MHLVFKADKTSPYYEDYALYFPAEYNAVIDYQGDTNPEPMLVKQIWEQVVHSGKGGRLPKKCYLRKPPQITLHSGNRASISMMAKFI